MTVEPAGNVRRARRGIGRMPRWVVNLALLPGLIISTLLCAIVVQWTNVYGVHLEENRSLDALVYMAYAFLAGCAAWLASWIVTPLRPRAPWLTIVVVTMLIPVTVVNVYTLNQARERVCPTRAQPEAPQPNNLPGPLDVHCAP